MVFIGYYISAIYLIQLSSCAVRCSSSHIDIVFVRIVKNVLTSLSVKIFDSYIRKTPEIN